MGVPTGVPTGSANRQFESVILICLDCLLLMSFSFLFLPIWLWETEPRGMGDKFLSMRTADVLCVARCFRLVIARLPQVSSQADLKARVSTWATRGCRV